MSELAQWKNPRFPWESRAFPPQLECRPSWGGTGGSTGEDLVPPIPVLGQEPTFKAGSRIQTFQVAEKTIFFFLRCQATELFISDRSVPLPHIPLEDAVCLCPELSGL